MANRHINPSIYKDLTSSATLLTAVGGGFPSTMDADDSLFVLKYDVDLAAGFPDFANAAGNMSGSLIGVSKAAYTDNDVIYLGELPANFAVKAAYLVFLPGVTGAGGTAPTVKVDLAGGTTSALIAATTLAAAPGVIIGSTGAGLATAGALLVPVVTSGATNPTYLIATLGGTMSTMTGKPKFRVIVEVTRL